MSESLAGVTFLAFGTGAPDVLSSISAGEGGDEGGIEMGFAIMLGSSLCILACVSAAVICYSPVEIILTKRFFVRDAIFLLASVLLLFYAIFFRGHIDIIMSALFLILYGAYALVVIYQDQNSKTERNYSEVSSLKTSPIPTHITAELNSLVNHKEKQKSTTTTTYSGSDKICYDSSDPESDIET